jgi:hypothetical protein
MLRPWKLATRHVSFGKMTCGAQINWRNSEFVSWQAEDYVGTWDPGYSGLPAELDEVRRELMSMSEGVDFLLDLLEELEINEVNDYCPQSTAHCFR